MPRKGESTLTSRHCSQQSVSIKSKNNTSWIWLLAILYSFAIVPFSSFHHLKAEYILHSLSLIHTVYWECWKALRWLFFYKLLLNILREPWVTTTSYLLSRLQKLQYIFVWSCTILLSILYIFFIKRFFIRLDATFTMV